MDDVMQALSVWAAENVSLVIILSTVLGGGITAFWSHLRGQVSVAANVAKAAEHQARIASEIMNIGGAVAAIQTLVARLESELRHVVGERLGHLETQVGELVDGHHHSVKRITRLETDVSGLARQASKPTCGSDGFGGGGGDGSGHHA